MYWDALGLNTYGNFRGENHFKDGGGHMNGVQDSDVATVTKYLRGCGAKNAEQLAEQFLELCALTCM